MKTAVLLTCFNRREKTKACLENLFDQKLPSDMELEVFLCDDGSTDGTGQMIQTHFPQVNITRGNGQLFWGGGMRKAWKFAKESGSYDFYLWLNDDTLLFPNALIKLWEEYGKAGKNSILVGACSIPGTKEFSYGGHGDPFPIKPNGTLQPIKFMNGNLVLIPSEVEEKIGLISSAYTHYLGDYDYAARAQKAGFTCYTSSEYLAECPQNDLPDWADSNLPLARRWKIAHDIKGLALNEYIHFKSYHQGSWVAFKSRMDVYLKILNPLAYVKLRNFILKKRIKESVS
ncbi:MAG: hypothetical protein B7Z16_10735 [Algoriphagus sp. 32-45-6]|nr:MAG: hypothetical protein B7Z16_10735 [Algoriphagus sp. 32-45-6]